MYDGFSLGMDDLWNQLGNLLWMMLGDNRKLTWMRSKRLDTNQLRVVILMAHDDEPNDEKFWTMNKGDLQ